MRNCLLWLCFCIFIEAIPKPTKSNQMGSIDVKESSKFYDAFIAELRRLAGESFNEEIIKNWIAGVTLCAPGTINEEWHEKLRSKVIAPLLKLKIAVLIVDFQNDFVNGSLSIKNGDAQNNPDDAIEPLNSILSNKKIDMVVYTLDWHPENHISFLSHAHDSDRRLSKKDQNRDLKFFDKVQFEEPNTSQILYPTHCVQGSWGAELDPRVDIINGSHMVRKGTDVNVDSYSAFFDNAKLGKTSLEDLLRSQNITAVLASGLAYDICVAATLKDSAELGFLSAIITDCSKGLSKDGLKKADKSFKKRNIARLNSSKAHSVINGEYLPVEWIQILFNQLKPLKDDKIVNGHTS